VRILDASGDTAGTGFVVTDDVLIATCAHVVESAEARPGGTVRLIFHHSGDEATAIVEPAGWCDPNAEDIAILRINEPLPEEVRPLMLAASTPAHGHPFETFGFPDTNPDEGLWGKGEILGETTLDGVRILQLQSRQVTSGFSGAPLWDQRGERVVGMVTAIANADQHGRQGETAFATPIEVLMKVWPNLSLAQSVPSGLPRLPYEPETVLIPAGPFLMGSDYGEACEAPLHKVTLPAYRIGKYPVTNAQYAEFVRRESHQVPPSRAWLQRKPPAGREHYPVVAVTWHDALAYCRWLSRLTDRAYRVPTEAEWEKAARGTDGRRYPWGNDWAAGYTKIPDDEITPVIEDNEKNPQPCQPQGASPYHCYDMVGNVQEWTSTLWGSSKKETSAPYPYRANDGREDFEADQYMSRVYRVCRGGMVKAGQTEIRCSTRHRARPQNATKTRGFRVVLGI
jgi:formylglycine-generating enzyme required for sulfatase activity